MGNVGAGGVELEQRLEETESARAAEANERDRLAKQLEDAIRSNEALQHRLDGRLGVNSKTLEDDNNVQTTKSFKHTDFSSLLDSWLSTLEDSQIVGAPEKEPAAP